MCVDYDTFGQFGRFLCVAVSKDGGEATYVYNAEQKFASIDSSEGCRKVKMCKQGDETYIVEITTSKDFWAGSDNIHASITLCGKGKKGNTTAFILDNKGKDDFERGAEDVFILKDVLNVGPVGCVRIAAGEDDKWKLDKVVVTRKRGGLRQTFTNKRELWLSSDEGEGVSELELCEEN